MPPRRRCRVCGSTQWHKETTTGLIACQEGHVLQDHVNETNEKTELGPHLVKKRTVKGRKHLAQRQTSTQRVYYGERARFHYFQCQQLIFRKQVAALSLLWDLPNRFEDTCREVWALHLALLPEPPYPEPLLFTEDNLVHEQDGELAESDLEGSSSSKSSQNSSSDDDDLEALMREASIVSETQKPAMQGIVSQTRSSRKQRTDRALDGPASNLAVLMVSCWLLRLPIIYADLLRLAETHDLPYMNPRDCIPPDMFRHLSRSTIARLTPNLPLDFRLGCQSATQLPFCGVLSEWLGEAPAMLYKQCKILSSVLGLSLTLHDSLAPPLERQRHYESFTHEGDNDILEQTLAAVVLLAIKLHDGLDDSIRPASDDCKIAAATLPDTVSHLSALSKKNKTHPAVISRRNIEMQTVLEWTSEDMDAYLEFCNKALGKERSEAKSSFPQESTFRLETEPDNNFEQPSEWQGLAVTKEAETCWDELLKKESDAQRRQQYTVYIAEDVSGELPASFSLVLKTLARWAVVDEDAMLVTVERLERRLVRWWRKVGKNSSE